jgi:hypothetical protein
LPAFSESAQAHAETVIDVFCDVDFHVYVLKLAGASRTDYSNTLELL